MAHSQVKRRIAKRTSPKTTRRKGADSQIVLAIRTKDIRPFALNPRKRFDKAGLERLARSIKQEGQITPGEVRPLPRGSSHKFELVDGERRILACQIAGIPTFRAVVTDITDAKRQFRRAVAANYNREEHTPVEDARACVELHDNHDMSWAEISDLMGRSSTWVTKRVSLLGIDPRVIPMIEPSSSSHGEIAVTKAERITAAPPAEQYALALRTIRENLGLTAVHMEVRRLQNKTGYRPGKSRQRVPADDYRTFTGYLARALKEAGHWYKVPADIYTAMFANRKVIDHARSVRALAALVVELGQLVTKVEKAKPKSK